MTSDIYYSLVFVNFTHILRIYLTSIWAIMRFGHVNEQFYGI